MGKAAPGSFDDILLLKLKSAICTALRKQLSSPPPEDDAKAASLFSTSYESFVTELSPDDPLVLNLATALVSEITARTNSAKNNVGSSSWSSRPAIDNSHARMTAATRDSLQTLLDSAITDDYSTRSARHAYEHRHTGRPDGPQYFAFHDPLAGRHIDAALTTNDLARSGSPDSQASITPPWESGPDSASLSLSAIPMSVAHPPPPPRFGYGVSMGLGSFRERLAPRRQSFTQFATGRRQAGREAAEEQVNRAATSAEMGVSSRSAAGEEGRLRRVPSHRTLTSSSNNLDQLPMSPRWSLFAGPFPTSSDPSAAQYPSSYPPLPHYHLTAAPPHRSYLLAPGSLSHSRSQPSALNAHEFHPPPPESPSSGSNDNRLQLRPMWEPSGAELTLIASNERPDNDGGEMHDLQLEFGIPPAPRLAPRSLTEPNSPAINGPVLSAADVEDSLSTAPSTRAPRRPRPLRRGGLMTTAPELIDPSVIGSSTPSSETGPGSWGGGIIHDSPEQILRDVERRDSRTWMDREAEEDESRVAVGLMQLGTPRSLSPSDAP